MLSDSQRETLARLRPKFKSGDKVTLWRGAASAGEKFPETPLMTRPSVLRTQSDRGLNLVIISNLPRETVLAPDELDNDVEIETSDIDTNTVFSIDSTGPTATVSSMTLVPEALAAADEFVNLILKDEIVDRWLRMGFKGVNVADWKKI